MRKAGLAAALVVAVGIAAAIAISSLGQGGKKPSHTQSTLKQSYAKLPLAFEPNRGQAEAGTAFLARGAGCTISLRPTEALFALGKRDTLRMRIAGANERAALVPEYRLEGKVNYLLGNDRSRWLTGIPTYARLRAADVYPGIDLAYYGRQGRLEYDFLVHPGASPDTISLRFAGARSLDLEPNGNLRLQLASGSLRQLAPRLYQQVGGERRRVGGRFVLHGRRVGFAVGPYDRSRTLVIDPTLAYSTYLGGSSADVAFRITVDAGGNAYVAGQTESTNFPTASAYQGGKASAAGDAFVTKLNPSGSALVYSTYLGGSAYDHIYGIAIDAAGNAYVTGATGSTDFPTASPYQATNAGNDGFVTKLNPSGSALAYSTYLGGSSGDTPAGIAVDSAGNAYVAGQTVSANFPTVSPYQAAHAGGLYDTFVTKLNASGSALLYSTYLGGSSNDTPANIAVDSVGNAYVGGNTASTNFPTASPYQAVNAGGGDAFVTKLNASGSALVYSTYLGGTAEDIAQDIAVESGGSAYLSGHTS